MKIVVLQGSPNKNGSSNMLANAFLEGARSAGHVVDVIDAAHANIHPCTGCVHCGYEGPCVQKDDVDGIRARILAADMMVFVTPLYYYGMSAQLKILVDRFCAFNSSIQRKHMKSAMIAAAWNADGWTFDALEAHYHTLVRYLNFKDMGAIWGKGCGTPSMTRCYMVLEQGALTGRYDFAHPFPAGSARAQVFGPILPQLDGILARLRGAASSHGVSVSQVAEAYAIAKGVLPIVGVTKEYQVEEAAQTTEIRLTAEEVASLEEAADRSGVTSVQFWESKME